MLLSEIKTVWWLVRLAGDGGRYDTSARRSRGSWVANIHERRVLLYCPPFANLKRYMPSISFESMPLHLRLQQALERLNLSEPTEVQSTVIPLALEGKDLQVSAETGSGKTLAYLLPLLNQMKQPAKASLGSRSLILVPTRELAQQVFKISDKLCKFTGHKVALVIGGQETRYQASLLRRDPELVVATPGRLLEHISRGSAELSNVEFLVLDEADRMLDMGFRDDVMSILKGITGKSQTVLLSATLNHSGVSKIAREILKDPQIVDLAKGYYGHQNITQQLILSDGTEHKRSQLLWLLENVKHEKTIVFCNKRADVTELKNWLRYKKKMVDELHGEIRQDDRKSVMRAFSQGAFNILVASDVAARGLDIEGVDLIVNFDVPHGGDDYVHRIGRTGRAGNSGLAITFVTASEWNLSISIQRFVGAKFERFEIPQMRAKYSGPKKTKSSGKAAGTKGKKRSKDKAPVTKKKRLRDKKAVGKPRRAATKKRTKMSDDEKSGIAPPKRVL